MIDLIFQVDLSTIYVIQRRDFLSIHDPVGVLSAPLQSRFYYDVTEANKAARGHCMREAERRGMNGATVVHCEKEGLYRGGWYVTAATSSTTTTSGRGGRFEVRVRKLRSSSESAEGEARSNMRGRRRSLGGVGAGAGGMMSVEGWRPRSFSGTTLTAVSEEQLQQQQQKQNDVGEEQAETSRSSSREERRRSRVGRLWDTIRRK